MTQQTTDPRVDDLRQKLRALGYLDGGVDRFVLGAATGQRRPIAIAVFSSLRIGLLAAVLLGPAAGIGVSARLPGLVIGPRDAIVVAIYLGVLFGAAATLVSFVACLVVAALPSEWIARRSRSLSMIAGGFVTIASLAYLTLWWRTANSGLGWSSPVWTAFALAVAAGISVLLGHAVRVTALAVVVSADRWSGTPAPRRPDASRIAAAGGIALAFAGAAALLLLTAPSEGRGARPASTLTVVTTGLRVRLVAIDGFDPGIFDSLARDGRVPALAAALSSTRGRLAAEPPPDPARVWTTIATGHPPDRHGVRGLETRRVAGIQGTVTHDAAPSRARSALRAATDLLRLSTPAVASGTERREKTFWEVADGAGLRTAVINWWATWPAPAVDRPDGPIVLTDRATLRLERGGPLDAEIAPAALFERLHAGWRTLRATAAARASEALHSVPVDPDARRLLQRSAELDALQVGLGADVSNATLDLLAIYLPGLDIAQRALLDGTAQSPSVVSARLDALRAYYICLDRLVGPLLAAHAGELVIVVTQPGRVDVPAEGLIGLSGSAARPGVTASGQLADVNPTVLHALGVPVSRALAGAPLTSLMSETFAKQHPVRVVDSYGSPSASTTVRAGTPLDQEAIDRLRSLGYIK
jgi:hypothetical protein